MKNILIIDPADFIGGAELFMLDFLKRADKTNNNFTVVTNGLKDYVMRLDETGVQKEVIKIQRIKSFNPFVIFCFIFYVFKIWRLIKRKKIDLILTNSIRAHIVGTFASRTAKTPIIWFIHDFTFPKFFIKRLIKTPEKVIVSSNAVLEFTKKQIIENFDDKIVIIPNGIDVEKVEKTAIEPNLKTKFNLGETTKLIGIVGRLDWWKGQDKAIEAMPEILKKVPNARLVIIGESSKYDYKTIIFEKVIRKKAEDLGIGDKVIFAGFISNIYGAIKQLDCLLHASTEPEPFGRVIIEGFACGVPVVASNLGGPGEIIRDMENGLKIDPKNPSEIAEKVVRILSDKEFAEELVLNAKKEIGSKYNLNKIVNSILKIWA